MAKKFRLLTAVLLIIALLAACGGGNNGDKDNNGDEQYGGKLVVYSPNSDGEIEGFLYYWGNKHGVTIELQSMGTGEVLSKLGAEKDNPQADVMFGAVTLTYFEENPDLFEKYVAKNNDNLPEAYQNNTGYYTNYVLSGANLLVNTELEAELGVEINSYADLLDPKLKGKIAMGDASGSASAWHQLSNMLQVMGDGSYEDDAAWDFVTALAENLDGKIQGSSSATYKNVYEGEYVVGITYEDPSVALLIDGATNVRVVYPPEGAVFKTSGSAIVKGAKNLENAQRFMDFLVSDEGQQIAATLTIRPVNPKFPNTNEHMTKFSDINVSVEDEAYLVKNKEAILERWKGILNK